MAAAQQCFAAQQSKQEFLADKKRVYSKEKQMAIFHYTLRNAKKLTAQNGLSLEENFAAIEAQRIAKAAAKDAEESAESGGVNASPNEEGAGADNSGEGGAGAIAGDKEGANASVKGKGKGKS